jgi:hypothetical protein
MMKESEVNTLNVLTCCTGSRNLIGNIHEQTDEFCKMKLLQMGCKSSKSIFTFRLSIQPLYVRTYTVTAAEFKTEYFMMQPERAKAPVLCTGGCYMQITIEDEDGKLLPTFKEMAM